MIPKSLSATSLLTAEGCLARWKAENLDKTPQPSGNAAQRGSTVHGALEAFVTKYMTDGTWDFNDLEVMLMQSFKEVFGSTDFETEEYKDCYEMTKKWFERTDVRDVTVVELENKKTFVLKTTIGDIPFTYIIDRLDLLPDGLYRVVDYKSIRAWLNPEDLRDKLQARVYALAIQIEHPEIDEIWVQFDMLRHEPISIKFTREDNANTWYALKRAAERIIEADENNLEETLNNECMYCVRKSSCDTLLRHNSGGGVYGKEGDEAVRLKLEVTSQLKALKYLEEELDGIILAQAENDQRFDWMVDDIEVKIGARQTTVVNNQAIAKVIGPELLERWGNLTVTSLNKLLKSGELTDEQVAEVKKYMKKEYGDPKPKVTRKAVI